jgi:hypothetical protein
MSTFRTRPNLSDLQFRQIPNTELNLSGTTIFTKEDSILKIMHDPINPGDYDGEDPFLRTDEHGIVYKEYVNFGGMGTDYVWSETVVPYKTNITPPTELYDLSNLSTDSLTSNYLKVIALFGLAYNTSAKRVSMGATVISEFIIHKDNLGTFHSSEIKSQHAGIYCRYGNGWSNPPTSVIPVTVGDILIFMESSKIMVTQRFGDGEMSDNELYEGINFDNTGLVNLKCNYRIELREMNLI